MAQNIEKMFAVRKIIKHFPLQRSSECNSGLEGCVHVHVTAPLHMSQETRQPKCPSQGKDKEKMTHTHKTGLLFHLKKWNPVLRKSRRAAGCHYGKCPESQAVHPPHAQVGSEILNWQSREFNSTYRGLRVGDGTEKGGADRGLPS